MTPKGLPSGLDPKDELGVLRLLRRRCHRQASPGASGCRVLEAGSLIISAQPLLLR
jgi:hypothetical protein